MECEIGDGRRGNSESGSATTVARTILQVPQPSSGFM
jgi:hypothetical protein